MRTPIRIALLVSLFGTVGCAGDVSVAPGSQTTDVGSGGASDATDGGALTDAADVKTDDVGPNPADTGSDPTDSGPVDSGPDPVDGGPGPVDGGPGPVDSGPDPVDSGPGPVDSGPDPVDGGPGPVDSGPDPVDGGPDPVDSGPDPVDGGPDPVDAGPAACTVGNNAPCGEKSFCAGLCGDTGVCTPKPEICAAIFDPVCGCDGQTYSNSCAAASKGMAVMAKGECGGGSGCKSAADCADANACTSDYCDTKTGKCIHDPKANGAPCDDGNICTKDDSCQVNAGGVAQCLPGKMDPCMSPDPCKLGKCEPKTGMCVYEPIADCNNSCGGKMGLICPKGQLCDYLMCGADILGVCVAPPKQPCPKTTPEAQVCGCDGVTYANDCLRKVAKAGLKSNGPCGGGDPGCCANDDECKGGICIAKVCKSTLNLGAGECWSDAQCGGVKCVGASVCPCGAQCIIADKPGKCEAPPAKCVVGGADTCGADSYCNGECGQPGACEAKPGVCTKEYNPMCGCDGNTHGNPCMAAAAGVAIQSKGTCGAGCVVAKDCDDGDKCTFDGCTAGVCVHKPDPACGPNGCCSNDTQCKGGVCAGTPGAEICKSLANLAKGQCWTDAQCEGGKCIAPSVCPCGANCFVPDVPGTCAAIK